MDLNKYPHANAMMTIQRHEDDIEMLKQRTANLNETVLRLLLLTAGYLVRKSFQEFKKSKKD